MLGRGGQAPGAAESKYLPKIPPPAAARETRLFQNYKQLHVLRYAGALFPPLSCERARQRNLHPRPGERSETQPSTLKQISDRVLQPRSVSVCRRYVQGRVPRPLCASLAKHSKKRVRFLILARMDAVGLNVQPLAGAALEQEISRSMENVGEAAHDLGQALKLYKVSVFLHQGHSETRTSDASGRRGQRRVHLAIEHAVTCHCATDKVLPNFLISRELERLLIFAPRALVCRTQPIIQ